MADSVISPPIKRPRHVPVLWMGLIGCAAILAVQIHRYWFLCDDAFISFRYARNLATGHGLVFNPGFERVEGYTNFLWVLLLAIGRWCGAAPERLCHVLSIAAGIAALLVLTLYCARSLPPGASRLWALWPAALLSSNRTFAMWCTSGLETKLFTALVIGGIIAVIHRVEGRDARRFPWVGLLLSLAALTRPEGILIGSTVLAAGFILTWRRLRDSRILIDAGIFVAVVAGHFAFRRGYYGDWLPNTYYAKVGGRTWWDIGWRYLALFALEYGLVLWLPLILLGTVAALKSRRFAAILIPLSTLVVYLVYIAAVGGDHFEYRPLDLVLPLLCLLVIEATRAAKGKIGAAAMGIWLVLTLCASVAIPEMIRQDFPRGYRTGFPGVTSRDSSEHDLIDATTRAELLRVPVIGAYLRAVNSLAVETSRHFVCIRQEEHQRFCEVTMQEGRWLSAAIARGELPHDLHLALGCVGATSYFADVRVLDVLGLTDRVVAKSPSVGERMMAHEKMASQEYLRAMHVDLRALDDVSIIFPDGHPRIMGYAQESALGIGAKVFAKLGDGHYLAAEPFQGNEALRRRLPNLSVLSAQQVLTEQQPAWQEDRTRNRSDEFGVAYDITLVDQGERFMQYSAHAEAKANLERALAINPVNRAALIDMRYYGLGRLAPQPARRSLAP